MGNLIGKFINVWLHPWTSMNAIKEEGDEVGIKSSIIFILVMGIVSGLITGIMGTIFPAPTPAGLPTGLHWLAVAVVPLVSFLGSFIGAFILWGFIIFGLLKGTMAEYKTTYRLLALLAAFSPISALLSPLPAVGQYLAIAINIWATIVMIRGIIIVMGTSAVRTWVMCGLIFGFLFLLGIAARFATQQQLAGGGIPGTTGAFDLDEETLNADLEALAEDAVENR